ncbi:hypothetical protein [Candidatus Nitrosocosmicus hydrocola]|nr:hypothetical protein [Candidatus Nitrosocosmicus hydrocola]
MQTTSEGTSIINAQVNSRENNSSVITPWNTGNDINNNDTSKRG